MKRIVLTGGGTAGHVTPHMALLPYLQQEGYEIHYLGTKNGIEKELMDVPGVTYHNIQSGKLRRYVDLKNLSDPFKVIAGCFQSLHHIRKIKPDVCFSKGGFVAVPVVIAAWLRHVPVLCHESDMTPGLANKISARFAQKIATTFPECAELLGSKAVCTGTAMRAGIYQGSREKGLQMCGFDGSKPVLLMMGGSSGAQAVNAALRGALPKLLPHMNVLHLTGAGNLDASLIDLPGYCQFEFLNAELPDAFACADYILSRAGSNAICELQGLKKPMLFVPYPSGASRGDQLINAEAFRKRGLCHVLQQSDMNAETLYIALMDLVADQDRLIENLKNAPPADGTQAILNLIHEIQK